MFESLIIDREGGGVVVVVVGGGGGGGLILHCRATDQNDNGVGASFIYLHGEGTAEAFSNILWRQKHRFQTLKASIRNCKDRFSEIDIDVYM